MTNFKKLEEMLSNIETYDAPSKDDYLYQDFEEFANGRVSARPSDIIKLFDQGNTAKCTWYGLQHIVNGYNILEDLRNENKVVREQKNPGDYDDDRPHSLQDRLLQFKNEIKNIEGYISIPKRLGKEERNKQIKSILDKGLFIYTGAEKVDWARAWNNPIITFKTKGIGHAFAIVDYGCSYNSIGNLYKIANSFGEDYGDNGYNYIKEDDVDKLFTCYGIIDKDDSGMFKLFKQQEKAKKIKELAKQLYIEGNNEQREYFVKIGLSKNLDKLYNIN